MENPKIRHLLGISGGKDSAALAIYMADRYPELNIEYYTCDTGKELDETYQLIENLQSYLGKSIVKVPVAEHSTELPFDHFLRLNGHFLPSPQMRWCTRKLKLDPFEKFVGEDSVVSYVGIRGDEDREGYISSKPNIQSIFPFRQNIWSEDVVAKVLSNQNLEALSNWYDLLSPSNRKDRLLNLAQMPVERSFKREDKLKLLLEQNTALFNQVVFHCLKSMNYPLSYEAVFPLLDNEDILVKADIFDILERSGVGIPGYYKELEYQIDGKKGHYARSRSGCFFCFYQQRIEWVWLYEQHPDKFAEAMTYEKDGYTWIQGETLEELIQPARVAQIKREHLAKMERQKRNVKSSNLVDILADDEEDLGCASCFV